MTVLRLGSDRLLIVRQRLLYKRECSAHVDCVLYESESRRQFLSDVDYKRSPRGLGMFQITFEQTVPTSFSPGKGVYHATPSYACNPLQQYYWPITREDTVLRFQIEPP